MDVALFVGEAAFTGVLGNAVYDGVRTALRALAERWKSRQRASADRPLTREEAGTLADVAVRLHCALGADDAVHVESVSAHPTRAGSWPSPSPRCHR